MSIFLSTFINKLDKKGRVSVPSAYRMTFAEQNFQGVVAFRSYRFPAIEVFKYELMENLVKGVDHLKMFSQERYDISATIFADSELLAFDPEGRIHLSKALIEYSEIEENVAFVGVGSFFQLWNPEKFKSHQLQARIRLQQQDFSFHLFPETLEKGDKSG